MKGLHQKDKEIIALLEKYPQGLFLSQIQEELKITSLQNAYARCAKLVKKNLLEKKDKLYKVTLKGIEATKTNAGMLTQTFKSNKPEVQTRIHNWGLEYPLKDKLDAKQPAKLLRLAGFTVKGISLRNNEQGQIVIGNITVRLTTKSLLLYTKDMYTTNRIESIDSETDLKESFDKVALDIEARMQRIASFKLLRLSNNILVSRVIKQHYAEEHHPMAESLKEDNVILARSPIDKQIRLETDRSKGFREAELKHHLTANIDKDSYDSQFNGVLDGKINLWDINRLKDEWSQTIGTLQEYRKQINLHLKVMKKIDQKLSQRKLEV